MPSGGLGQLIEVEHCSSLSLSDDLENGHTQASRGRSVGILAERVAADFGRSGVETVSTEPRLGDEPPAGWGIAVEPLVMVGGWQLRTQ